MKNTARTAASDLAISAVPSDVGFISELQAELATDLTFAAPHLGPIGLTDEIASALDPAQSSIALVLYQRLWPFDPATRRDEIVLRDRLRDHPKSVCVVMLEDAPAPKWLSACRRYDLATEGRAGMNEFVLDAVASSGGRPREKKPMQEVEAAPRWPAPPVPFLGQPRAHSALRHELDAITGELEVEIERSRAALPESIFELHVQPNRVIARMQGVAVSMSWINGRQATVADGRLMVIAWRDVAAGVRGVNALKFAAPTRERTYHVAGKGPAEWCWRADDPTDMPYSSLNLAADWIAQASMARAD